MQDYWLRKVNNRVSYLCLRGNFHRLWSLDLWCGGIGWFFAHKLPAFPGTRNYESHGKWSLNAQSGDHEWS